jgi:glucose-6-phosphate isomerase, archaeal
MHAGDIHHCQSSDWREVAMNGLFPALVSIDASSGALSPATGRYEKRLSGLQGIFRDGQAFASAIREGNDPLVYEVMEFKKEGSDIFFGTTTMQPGKVGDEFFMTRGHFHARRDLGEVYCTQSGTGVLLLENRYGVSQVVDMLPGTCAFIPPDWAHRSINTGSEPLVFTWFCNVDAGHDYAAILERGMRKLVVERNGKPEIVANPRFD